MCISIHQIHQRVDAKSYYQRELAGAIGQHTGKGWYKTTALCPFHADKSPGTFYINVQTGKYKCFSCGTCGDFIDFHQHKYRSNLPQTLQSMWRAYA
ncbi:MAG: CHC2 zinc finger domain-containing protein [Alphaproteobacteria bacterium]|nr:CHC2 zinc finger domain-containing protein [Alphaproteobacteria bacterium]MDD9919362.1 CHC2 zinc finger domain-containing protein [Alphaproteobacteria bacterium]